jgi:hypothetical protein
MWLSKMRKLMNLRTFLDASATAPIRDVRSRRARSDHQLGRGGLFVRRAHGTARDAKLGCQVLPGRQTNSRGEHAALDGGPDAFGSAPTAASSQIDQAPTAAARSCPSVHEFCAFLVSFCGPRQEAPMGARVAAE